MKPKALVYAVGETVFDIIFRDFQPQAAKPGGSAFNAMVSLGRIGIPGYFISEVGNDRVGNHIRDFLNQNGVETEYLIMFEDGKSALSLAFLNESSDAEYDFYKDYPRQRLNKNIPSFTEFDFLLFGSFYGLNPVLRPQIELLLSEARKKGSLVFYDPNFRSSHLDDLDALKGIIENNFKASDIVRASDEDLFNIYGVNNVEEAWSRVSPFCSCLIYTANAKGIHFISKEMQFHLDVEKIEPLSTIGAGDTFNAGIIYGLYKRNVSLAKLPGLKEADWKDILRQAAEFSSEVCLSYENYISKDFAKKVRIKHN